MTAIRDGKARPAGPVKIWHQFGRDVGAVAISLRTLEIAGAASIKVRNPGCDEVIYVLEGHGSIALDDHWLELQPETGIYVKPDQTFSVWNPNPEPIVLISSQCPEPDRQVEILYLVEDRVDGKAIRATKLPGLSMDVANIPWAAQSTQRAAEPHARFERLPGFPTTVSTPEKTAPLVRLADRKALPTGDRWYRVLVDDEVGCTQVTQFIGSIPPGRAPDHFHLYEEVLVILRGEGRMWAGASSTPIGPGSCIYLPKRQPHCVENTGADELRLLGVFYPAGSPAVRYDAEEFGV